MTRAIAIIDVGKTNKKVLMRHTKIVLQKMFIPIFRDNPMKMASCVKILDNLKNFVL